MVPLKHYLNDDQTLCTSQISSIDNVVEIRKAPNFLSHNRICFMRITHRCTCKRMDLYGYMFYLLSKRLVKAILTIEFYCSVIV